MDDRTAFIAIG